MGDMKGGLLVEWLVLGGLGIGWIAWLTTRRILISLCCFSFSFFGGALGRRALVESLSLMHTGDFQRRLYFYFFYGAGEAGAEESGKLALGAMVQANALAYRPKSKLARDIPLEVFGKSGVVATAMTPAHLHAMWVMRKRGRF